MSHRSCVFSARPSLASLSRSSFSARTDIGGSFLASSIPSSFPRRFPSFFFVLGIAARTVNERARVCIAAGQGIHRKESEEKENGRARRGQRLREEESLNA